jgi:putative endonuclease
MAAVYILYAASIDAFYIGSCQDLTKRCHQHTTKFFAGAHTAKADDWDLFYSQDGLEGHVARKIEGHIKKMKSRKYYHDLLKYPEIMTRLIEKYGAGSSR